jgi:insertion element IS1 protein InsB
VAFSALKKTKVWIWKALCRTTGELIDWELGDRSAQTLEKLVYRLAQFDVKMYYTDRWETFAELILPEVLTQTKAETHNIERNNGQQRHWFARFRRRTCVVSHSLEMINCTVALFAKFHSPTGKRSLRNLRWIP